jgi:hypothetical protein
MMSDTGPSDHHRPRGAALSQTLQSCRPFGGLRIVLRIRGRGEMVDARDLKSLGGNPVRVRVPPSAPSKSNSLPVHVAVIDFLADLATILATFCNFRAEHVSVPILPAHPSRWRVAPFPPQEVQLAPSAVCRLMHPAPTESQRQRKPERVMLAPLTLPAIPKASFVEARPTSAPVPCSRKLLNSHARQAAAISHPIIHWNGCTDRWFILLDQPNNSLQCWLKARDAKRPHSTTREVRHE